MRALLFVFDLELVYGIPDLQGTDNHISILPPPYSEQYVIGAPPITIVPFYHCLIHIVP
jgi:hypothetical protein